VREISSDNADIFILTGFYSNVVNIYTEPKYATPFLRSKTCGIKPKPCAVHKKSVTIHHIAENPL
jgi:hypothetical protein